METRPRQSVAAAARASKNAGAAQMIRVNMAEDLCYHGSLKV
jgi:hypothetical protein